MSNVNINNAETMRKKKILALDIVQHVVYIIVSDLQIRILPGLLTSKLLKVVHPYDKILSKLLIYNNLNTLREANENLENIMKERVRPYNAYKRLLNARQNAMQINLEYKACERRYQSSIKDIWNTPWYKRLENTIVSEIGIVQTANSLTRGQVRKKIRDKIGPLILNKFLCKNNIQGINQAIRHYRNINLSRNVEDRTTEAINILDSLIDKGELLRAFFLQLGKCAKMNVNNLIQTASPTPQVNQGQQSTFQRTFQQLRRPRFPATFMTPFV